jgi:class 3 adenylate cyclase
VVGEMGGGSRHEQLALGDTPNLAARLQGLAAPNTLVISAATLPLLGGFFVCQALGPWRQRQSIPGSPSIAGWWFAWSAIRRQGI